MVRSAWDLCLERAALCGRKQCRPEGRPIAQGGVEPEANYPVGIGTRTAGRGLCPVWRSRIRSGDLGRPWCLWYVSSRLFRQGGCARRCARQCDPRTSPLRAADCNFARPRYPRGAAKQTWTCLCRITDQSAGSPCSSVSEVTPSSSISLSRRSTKGSMTRLRHAIAALRASSSPYLLIAKRFDWRRPVLGLSQ